MRIRLQITLLVLVINFVGLRVRAHEPLYGLGPHTLFQGGWAPHITAHFSNDHFETEYALGYGITENWTTVMETPWHLESGNYQWGGLNVKNKYRFVNHLEPGLSRQVSAVSKVKLPRNTFTEEEAHHESIPKIVNLGITGGQEALHFYWFGAAGYNYRFTGETLEPGNQVFYNATIGYRPFNVEYDQPDLVLFLEGVGRYQFQSVKNGETVNKSGGNHLAVAPTFFLTYRNIALRGGVQFGLQSSGYVQKPETNYKLTLELHL